jgi:hypothetical protein
MGTYQQFSVGGETIGGMFAKSATLPHPYWLYYFNIDDIEAAAKRAEPCGGQVLYGRTVVPGGAKIVHCTDPQGAIFGPLDRSRKAIGYFESPPPRKPFSTRRPRTSNSPQCREVLGCHRGDPRDFDASVDIGDTTF